jgi:hypothetical protein
MKYIPPDFLFILQLQKLGLHLKVGFCKVGLGTGLGHGAQFCLIHVGEKFMWVGI